MINTPLALVLTSGGYVFLLVAILSVCIPYYMLSDKKPKPGCLAIGLGAMISLFVLMFPAFITVQFFEHGSTMIRAAIIAGWIIIFGILIAIRRSKKANLGWSIATYIFFAICGGLLLMMIGGMGYFVYLRMFTHEKDDAPVWAVFLCIFFLAVLILVFVGQLFNRTKSNKEGKNEFDDLEEAKLTPDVVFRLNLVSKGLTDFPDEILKFPNLSYLDLSNNQINKLPADILKLKFLTSIKLSHNPISDQQRADIRKLFPPETELIFRT